ncbi:MAG: ABC transporter ATP-binding protein [Candidatus Zixiibacteriota bacterium]
MFLEIKKICRYFNGITALEDFSTSISSGEIVGLIGPNGAGKTTLFNVITGFLKPDSGTISFNNIDLIKTPPFKIYRLGITRTFQEIRLIRGLKVVDNILLSFRGHPGDSLLSSFAAFKAVSKREHDHILIAKSLLEKAELVEKTNVLAEDLSYGQQKLLSILCCLASDAELLLLDEPIAGIAPEFVNTILAIIRELAAQNKAIIIIEHNMDIILNMCNRVIFMDSGRKICEGPPDIIRNDPKVIEAYIG